jgi:hypothetical protein
VDYASLRLVENEDALPFATLLEETQKTFAVRMREKVRRGACRNVRNFLRFEAMPGIRRNEPAFNAYKNQPAILDSRDNTLAERRPMPSSIYAVFRNAILREQQVTCSYEGRHRELCPHIIGTNKVGEEVVLAWQFAGMSSGKLPQWRCLKLANVREARARDGRWHAGGSHKTTQKCVTEIDLDINVHVRKLR